LATNFACTTLSRAKLAKAQRGFLNAGEDIAKKICLSADAIQ
jgi:hypothetical protein